MMCRLVVVLVVLLLAFTLTGEAKRRKSKSKKSCKYAMLTIKSSDCNRPVENVTFVCNKTMRTLKSQTLAPGLHQVNVKRLPKTITISKDGFQTMVRTLQIKEEMVILQCAGASCTTNTLTVNVTSTDCNKTVQGVIMTSTDVKEYTTNVPGTYELAVCSLPVTVEFSKHLYVTKTQTFNSYTGTVNMICSRASCSTNTLTVNVTSDCIDCVQGVLMTSTDVKEYTTTVPGTYELAVCSLPVTVEFSKHLFVTKSQTFNSYTGTVNMICRQRPYLVEHPQSKYRAQGENVKWCCAAVTKQPTEIKYKWYHNGVEISSKRDLEITNIGNSDKGVYKCKASITVDGMTQAIMSEEAELTIIADSSDFSTDLRSRMVELVTGCTVDAGYCNPRSCKTVPASTEECTDDGYVCPLTQNDQEECGLPAGMVPYTKVVGCKCCPRPLKIKGEVIDFKTGDPIIGATVKIEHIATTTTDAIGVFENPFGTGVRRLLIKTSHPDNYIESVRVERVPNGFVGTLNVKIIMFKKAEPVSIDSSMETTITVSSTPLVESSSDVTLRIPKDCFFTTNKKKYTGMVKAFITDFSGEDREKISNAPGVFITYNEDGTEQPLISQKVFVLEFQDSDGNPLLSKTLPVFGDISWFLWKLSSADGTWLRLLINAKRRRREVVIGQLGQIDPNNLEGFTIWNIDKFPQMKQCWFKTRVFNEANFPEQIEDVPGMDLPGIYLSRPVSRIFTTDNDFLPLYFGSTPKPGETCYPARCDDNIDDGGIPDTVGLIELEVSYFVGGANLVKYQAKANKLDALDLVYGDDIKTALTSLGLVVTDDIRFELQFHSSATGPFYENEVACISSNLGQPAFWFKVPPYPEESDPSGDPNQCYARVAYKGDANVITKLADIFGDDMDAFTAFSKWENMFFEFKITSIVFLDIQATMCVRYRCSDGDDSLTTVEISQFKVENVFILCTQNAFNPPTLANNGNGYFFNMDAEMALLACGGGGDLFAHAATCEMKTNQSLVIDNG